MGTCVTSSSSWIKGQASEAGGAPLWLQGPVPRQDTNEGLLLLGLDTCCKNPAQCHLSWVLEVTQIPSEILVLDPPVCSELGAAELLDSLKEGKLSKP